MSNRPRTGRSWTAAALVLTVAGAGLTGTAVAAAPEPFTEIVSVTALGAMGTGPSTPVDVSADGRYVLYSSSAMNLAPDDNVEDGIDRSSTMLLDRATGLTRNLNWLPTNTYLRPYPDGNALSASGRFALLTTTTHATATDTNGAPDAYVRDLQTDTVVRASLQDDDSEFEHSAIGQGISADGRFALFTARLPDNPRIGLYVRDLVRGRTIRMDVAGNGTPGGGNTTVGSISPNGRYVAFSSLAVNLAPDDLLCEEWWTTGDDDPGMAIPVNCLDVFLHDRDPDGDGVFDETGATTLRVSTTNDGHLANGHSALNAGSVSNDGDVVFAAKAPNLGPDGVYVRDHRGTVSFVAPGEQGRITLDGGLVAFTSDSADLVPGDLNGTADAFLHDRGSGGIELVSRFAGGTFAGTGGYAPVPSADGRFVAFASTEGSVAPTEDQLPPPNVFLRFRGGEAPAQGTASQPVTGGETVSTDPLGEGATPANPVQTSITVPEVAGTVTVTTGAPTAIAGYTLFGKQVAISAPAATATDPYVATFTIDAATLAGMAPSNIQVFRNGAAVGACTHATDAVPNPCVAKRGLVTGGGGDAYVTVRTSQFSTWSFGRNRAPKVSSAYASPNLMTNPDSALRTITIKGVTDADKNKVTIKITKVTQDEKVYSKPDAYLTSTSGQVKLRAERSSTGNGRVYKIYFTATDSYGAKTTGSETVTVRRYSTKSAVDSGQKYVSTKAS